MKGVDEAGWLCASSISAVRILAETAARGAARVEKFADYLRQERGLVVEDHHHLSTGYSQVLA